MTNASNTLLAARPLVSHDQIARRAYDIWIAKGRPDGEALQHWLIAEALLIAELRRHASFAQQYESSPPAPVPETPPHPSPPRTRSRSEPLIVH